MSKEEMTYEKLKELKKYTPTTGEVINVLREKPCRSIELAAELGIWQSTTCNILKELVKDGVVTKIQAGHYVYYGLTEKLTKAE